MRFVFQDVSSSLGQGHPYYYTALASSTGTHNEYGLSDGADIQCEEIGPGIQYTVNTARKEINSEGHERTLIEKEELGKSMEEENPSEEISTKARAAAWNMQHIIPVLTAIIRAITRRTWRGTSILA